ncbi:hypothetical protein IFR05_016692, partial [Cadophora sp. M221]
ELNWKLAFCTNCNAAYCYGVLWRAFDLMPQTVMEDKDWKCPSCLRICSCSKCRKGNIQKPYKPKRALLGHDTRKVADPRSVESLVDFSRTDLSRLRDSNARMKKRKGKAEVENALVDPIDDGYLGAECDAFAIGGADIAVVDAGPSFRGPPEVKKRKRQSTPNEEMELGSPAAPKMLSLRRKPPGIVSKVKQTLEVPSSQASARRSPFTAPGSTTIPKSMVKQPSVINPIASNGASSKTTQPLTSSETFPITTLADLSSKATLVSTSPPPLPPWRKDTTVVRFVSPDSESEKDAQPLAPSTSSPSNGSSSDDDGDIPAVIISTSINVDASNLENPSDTTRAVQNSTPWSYFCQWDSQATQNKCLHRSCQTYRESHVAKVAQVTKNNTPESKSANSRVTFCRRSVAYSR